MVCIECGAALEVPKAGPVECQACGRVYIEVDDVGWFDQRIVIYSAEDDEE
jgi:hypothetical protein